MRHNSQQTFELVDGPPLDRFLSFCARLLHTNSLYFEYRLSIEGSHYVGESISSIRTTALSHIVASGQRHHFDVVLTALLMKSVRGNLLVNKINKRLVINSGPGFTIKKVGYIICKSHFPSQIFVSTQKSIV